MIDSKINQNLCQDRFENNYLYTNKCIFLLRDTWRKICPVLCDKLVVEDFVIHKERKIAFPSIDMKKFINFLKKYIQSYSKYLHLYLYICSVAKAGQTFIALGNICCRCSLLFKIIKTGDYGHPSMNVTFISKPHSV